MAECSGAGCDRKHLAKGFCKLHYYRVYRGRSIEPVLAVLEKQFKALPKTKLAYAAGFIDADGSIMLTNSKLRGVSPRIAAVCIDREPLDFLGGLFGGKPYQVQRRVRSKFTIWTWHIHGSRAIAAARALMPYLLIKGVQAYLLSCFDYEAEWTKGGTDVAMPDHEAIRRQRLVAEMRAWNGRHHLQPAQGIA